MGIKNQSGQALAEFVIACLFFMMLLIVIEKLIQTRKTQSNKYKVSKEISFSNEDKSFLRHRKTKNFGEVYE